MPLRKFFLLSVIVFGVLALINYFPVVRGKVPFPAYIIEALPPWQPASESGATERHAELGDLATMFYPWRTFAAQAVRQFKLPLWNHQILGGTPFLANGQSGVFYPVNFLYYLLPVHTAWSLRLILQIILAGSFMSLFVRAIGGSVYGSLAAGVIYSLSGYVTAWQGHLDAPVWLPLMFFSVDRLERLPSLAPVLLLALHITMPVLAGHPETAIHLTLAAGAFALIRFGLLAKSDVKGAAARILLLILAGAIAAGFAAAQWIPMLEWMRDLTHRADIIWPSAQLNQFLGL